MTWYMPNHHQGHLYQNWFDDLWQAAVYVKDHLEELHHRSKTWQRIILNSELPVWLKDALINNLYVLTSGSWLTREGRFVLYESPQECPLMGTLDVFYYGSLPLALLFPQWSKNALLQFAQAQRKDGYVPHDLGFDRIDAPSDGTSSPPRWKDLCPKFILLALLNGIDLPGLAYHDFLWNRDEAFLKRIYPHVKRAMQWEMATDKNGDHLPDNEGMDQTFDIWDFYGTNSYTASIFLASLLAWEKMAQIQGDTAFSELCRKWWEKGRESFETELWQGEFYRAASGEQDYNTCTAGQLNGQWYAHLLELGYILSPKRVNKAVASICRLNASASEHGVVNSVFADGRRDTANDQSQNVWVGESYAVASLAIYEGLVEEGLTIAEKVWRNITQNQKNPWNQPDIVQADTGEFGFGDHYMRNMGIWGVFLALAKKEENAKRVLQALRFQKS